MLQVRNLCSIATAFSRQFAPKVSLANRLYGPLLPVFLALSSHERHLVHSLRQSWSISPRLLRRSTLIVKSTKTCDFVRAISRRAPSTGLTTPTEIQNSVREARPLRIRPRDPLAYERAMDTLRKNLGCSQLTEQRAPSDIAGLPKKRSEERRELESELRKANIRQPRAGEGRSKEASARDRHRLDRQLKKGEERLEQYKLNQDRCK